MTTDDRLREIHDRIRALPTEAHRRIGHALWTGMHAWMEGIRQTWGEQTPAAKAMLAEAAGDTTGRLADLESLLSADQLIPPDLRRLSEGPVA